MNRVDQILGLAVDEVGEALACVPEDQWFERKSIRVAAKDFAVALVALANAEGGIAVVGLHDGTVEGVRHHTGRVNDLRQALLNTPSRRCAPTLNRSAAATSAANWTPFSSPG